MGPRGRAALDSGRLLARDPLVAQVAVDADVRQDDVADVLQDVAANYPPPGSTVTSDNVKTTGPATLIAVWWGDAPSKDNTAEPGDGFTVIESLVKLPEGSAVQCVVAYKEVDQAGTYNVTWTHTPEQSAPLWLFAFQSSAAVAPNAAK